MKTSQKPLLSVVTITKNEQNMLPGCLVSLKNLADEIIIVDQFSTDQTVKIAEKYTDKVFKRKFTGFASQKNFGISKAKGDWIIVIDADERVSPQLAKEIREELKNPRFDAYILKRLNFYYGEKVAHGGWQDDKLPRLFKRGKAKYGPQEVHEILDIKGTVGELKAPLYHFSHRTIYENLLKTALYADMEADVRLERGDPQVTPLRILKEMWQHFYYRFFKKKGYKDGMAGFIETMYQVFSYVFIIQAMLWERQRPKQAMELYKELDKKLLKE